MKRARVIAAVQDVLIVLLIVSAVFLILEGGYFPALSERLTVSSSVQGTAVSGADMSEDPVMPYAVVVCAEAGRRHAVMFDASALSECWHTYSANLGEALGTAREAAGVSEDDWRALLEAPCVYFDFYESVPLALLSGLLGAADCDLTASATRLLLTFSGDSAVLAWQEAESGEFYAAETSAGTASLLEKAAAYSESNACFAYESKYLSKLDPYTVIGEGEIVMPVLTSAAADLSGTDLDSLYTLFGMDAWNVHTYTESDGTRVYVESSRTIRISPQGKLSFKRTGTAAAAAQSDTAALTEAVHTACSVTRLFTALCGTAGYVFSDVQTLSSGAVQVVFALRACGVPISGGEETAVFTLQGGSITACSVCVRTYAETGEYTHLLPMLSAGAAAGQGALHLLYTDDGTQCRGEWVS